jgi:hypothetical protein
MMRLLVLATMIMGLAACNRGGNAPANTTPMTTLVQEATQETESEALDVDTPAVIEDSDEEAETTEHGDLESHLELDSQNNRLPVAPWENAPLASHAAPSSLLRAWREADNRDWCPPLAPRDFADAHSPRTAELEGGWSIEFDRPGMPGFSPEGMRCDECGRGAFGIAGTSMTVNDLIDDGTVMTSQFMDGSHASMETSTDGAAATILVAGELCVYQVWSLAGEDHLQQLVSALRRVETPSRVASR